MLCSVDCPLIFLTFFRPFPLFSESSPCTTTPGLSHCPFLVASIPF